MATASRLLHHLTIVPAAHVRIFDFPLQMRLYDLFHRRTLSLVGHAVCTPIIVFCMLAAAAHAPLPFVPAPALAVLLAAVLVSYYLYVDRLVGVVLLPYVAALTAGASWFASSWGPSSLAIALVGMVAFTALQTFSHALDGVPPPLSEGPGLEPVGQWARRAPLGKVVLTMVLSATVFVGLEMFAAPRVLACQVARSLYRLGYAPERWSRMKAEADRLEGCFMGEPI
jgi:hypothetical protein